MTQDAHATATAELLETDVTYLIVDGSGEVPYAGSREVMFGQPQRDTSEYLVARTAHGTVTLLQLCEFAVVHTEGLTVELSGARADVWVWHFIHHASAPLRC